MSACESKENVNRHSIKLTNNKRAIVDPELYNELTRFTWRAVKSGHCWYAVRREQRSGKVYNFKMHRVIARTPNGFVCHHKNGNPLDNRRINLDNMYPLDHQRHHIVYRHQKRLQGERREHLSHEKVAQKHIENRPGKVS